MQHAFDLLFGASAETITWWQMMLRTAVIFLYGIVILRFGFKRVFGQSSDFDIVVAMLVGSAMSRALTGNAPLFPTLLALTALLVLHALLARLACRWGWLGRQVKGVEVMLIEQGGMNQPAMRRAGVTEHDLLEAVRARGAEDLTRVKLAVLERSGKISIILKDTDG